MIPVSGRCHHAMFSSPSASFALYVEYLMHRKEDERTNWKKTTVAELLLTRISLLMALIY